MDTPWILLAEDNPDDQRLTLRALRTVLPQVPVVVASDGDEAMQVLQDTSRPCPALALLDVKMPKLTGLEVAEAMRKLRRCGKVPVVMLTSSDEERDIITAYECGANSFVQKPVDAKMFSATVGELGLYWVTTNVGPK